MFVKGSSGSGYNLTYILLSPPTLFGVQVGPLPPKFLSNGSDGVECLKRDGS